MVELAWVEIGGEKKRFSLKKQTTKIFIKPEYIEKLKRIGKEGTVSQQEFEKRLGVKIWVMNFFLQRVYKNIYDKNFDAYSLQNSVQ